MKYLIAALALIATPAFAAPPTFPASVANMSVPDNMPTDVTAQATNTVSYEVTEPSCGQIVRRPTPYQFVYIPAPGCLVAPVTFSVTAVSATGERSTQARILRVYARGAPLYPAMILGQAVKTTKRPVEAAELRAIATRLDTGN